jgi:hypothetical protein
MGRVVIDYPTRGQRLGEGLWALFGLPVWGLVVLVVTCVIFWGVDGVVALWEGRAALAAQYLMPLLALHYALVCLLTFARHATDESISMSRHGLKRAVRYHAWLHRLGLRESPVAFVSWKDVSQVAVGLCSRNPLEEEEIIAIRLKASTEMVPIALVHRDALDVLECIAALVPAARWTPLARHVLGSLRRGVRPSDASSQVVHGLMRLAREGGIRGLGMEDRLRKCRKREPLLERFNAEPERYLQQMRRLLGFIIVLEPRPVRAT